MRRTKLSRHLLTVSLALLISLGYQNCAPKNLTSTTSTKSETGADKSSEESNQWCSVQAPSSIFQNQELSVFVNAQELSRVQISSDTNSFSDLTTMNGTNTFPANTYDVGTTSLHFRGVKADGAFIDCMPATLTIEIKPPSSTPPSSGDSSGGKSVHPDYVPLVGFAHAGSSSDPLYNSGFKNFKDVYKPQSSMLMDMASSGASGEKCYRISTRHSAEKLTSNKLRVYLPPGTKTFYISVLTYYDLTTEQVASYRFNAPPISTIDKAGLDGSFWAADTKRNLEYIVGGREYVGKVGAGGNIMPSFGTITGNDYLNHYIYKTPQGGWLYMNFLRIIGGKAYHMETRACVDPVTYENWYRSAKWDQDGNPL